MSVRKPSLTCNFPENHAALSLIQPNNSAFQKHELNNSLLKKHPGTTRKGECENGPIADNTGWQRIAGRRILFHGPWQKFKAIEDEVRKEALSAREWPLLAPTLPPPSANTKRM